MNKPQAIATEDIYKGKIFDVHVAHVREGEVEYSREIVSHKGSVVIVPMFADSKVALVRQYRYAAGEYLLELPAGTLEKHESAEIGAKRELEEEIGVTAGKIEKLSEFYVSPGFLTEKMFVYLAADLTETQQNFDDDEFIEVEKLSFPQIFEMIRRNEFKDAKTMLGLILAGAKFGFTYTDAPSA